MTSTVQSSHFFKLHWQSWTVLGANRAGVQTRLYRRLYRFYSLVLHALITVLYPLHIYLGLIFRVGNIFESLALSVTCFSIVYKFLYYVSNLHKVRRMEAILRQLDARVRHREERKYFAHSMRRNMRSIVYVFVLIYVSFVATWVSTAFSEEQRLLLPAWLPWDWRASRLNFGLAIAYQIFGGCAQMAQSYGNNSFAPMALCLLSGHIRLLYKRIVRIGYGDGGIDRAEDRLELHRCIMDQQNLYNLFEIIIDIIGMPEVVHFFFIAVNMSLVIASLMFYIDTIFGRIFYVAYLLSLMLQLFPICYYGSTFALNFGRLQYAAFCCNWIGQSRGFKQDMIIFTERSLKVTPARAGGMFDIHLGAFFTTCKATYSLICAIWSMKK